MTEFTNSNENFLWKFLNSKSRFPSEDTINRVFSSIDSNQFESCFVIWVNSISEYYILLKITLNLIRNKN